MPRSRRRPAAGPRRGVGSAVALVLTLAGCASLSPAPTPADPAGAAEALLAVELVGGMCPSGKECRQVRTLSADGTWRSADETGAVEEGRVDDGLLAQVADAVATADRDRLTATPFTGECERNMDGTEVLITLRPGEPDELVLSSCVYELPTEGPLMEAVVALREAA